MVRTRDYRKFSLVSNEGRCHNSFPGYTIMRIVYGAKDLAQTKRYVLLAENALDSVRRMCIPGAFLAETLPFLKYVPACLPGGAARRFATKYKPVVQAMRNEPFEEVKQAMVSFTRARLRPLLTVTMGSFQASGTWQLSIASNLSSQFCGERSVYTMTPDAETLVKDVTAVAYAGQFPL